MSTTTTTARTMTHAHGRRATRGRVVNGTLWALQALLALSFASAGMQKLAGTPYMVDLFARIGVGQCFRYMIGLIELAGAIGLVLPPLSGRAALGLVALMVGATATNLFIGYSPWVPLSFLLVSALVVWGRWPQTMAIPGSHTTEKES